MLIRVRTLVVDTVVSGFVVLLLSYFLRRHPDLIIILSSILLVVVVVQVLRNALERAARLLLDSADMEDTVSSQNCKPHLIAQLKNLITL